LPADITRKTRAPAATHDSKNRAFNFLFGLLHRDQFREFAQRVGVSPNLCVPKSASDKFLWRKLFDHNPQFTVFSDKLAAKQYVANLCPDIPAAKVIWQGTNIDQAPAVLLKGPGILKSNHGAGFNLKLGERPRDIDELRAITTGWLRGWHHTKPKKWKYRGQWGYKNIRRTLFIEEDLAREGGGPIVDIAVNVCCGKVTHFNVTLDNKTKRHRYARFHASGRLMQIEVSSAKLDAVPEDFKPPVSLTRIFGVAKRIAGAADQLRVDLMWNGQDLYFGEITVYAHAGFVAILDQALLAEITEAWDLRRSWFLTHPQSGWRRLYADWLRRTLDAQDEGSPP